MIALLAVALGAVLGVFVYMSASKRRTRSRATVTHDTTPALEQFLRRALEQLLAPWVLGVPNSTVHERASIRRALAGDPDPAVVAKIEELVKWVELEFVRYAKEPDVEATVRVRHEDGRLVARSERLPLADIPATVLRELEAKQTTNVFRTWSFDWQTPDPTS